MNPEIGRGPCPLEFMAAVMGGMSPSDAAASVPRVTIHRESKGKKALYMRAQAGTLQPRTGEGQEVMRKLIALGTFTLHEGKQQDHAVEAAGVEAKETATTEIQTARREQKNHDWPSEKEKEPEPEPEKKKNSWLGGILEPSGEEDE